MPNNSSLINWGHLTRFGSNLKNKFNDERSRIVKTTGYMVLTEGDMSTGVISGNSMTPQYTSYKRFLNLSMSADEWGDMPVFVKVDSSTGAIPMIRYGLYDTSKQKLEESSDWELLKNGMTIIDDPNKIRETYDDYGYFTISILFTSDGDKSNAVDKPSDFRITFYGKANFNTRITELENALSDLSNISVFRYLYDMGNGTITSNGMEPQYTTLGRFRSTTFDVDTDFPNNVPLWFKGKTNDGIIPMYQINFFNSSKIKIASGTWISCGSNEFDICFNTRTITDLKSTLSTLKYIAFTFMFTTDGTQTNYIDTPPSIFEGKFYYKNIGNKTLYVVDKNGNGDFKTILEAVNSTADNDTIIVNPGVYEEVVKMWGKKRHIIGVDKYSCILTNGTGSYSTPPLEMNKGSIENMTVYADTYDPTVSEEDTEGKCYAIHSEASETAQHELRITNCILKANWNSAIGIGVRYNQHVIIENTEMITNCDQAYSSTSGWIEMGALFFHNDAIKTSTSGGKITVKNCYLHGAKAALSLYSLNNGSELDCEFIGNTLVSDTYGVADTIINDRDQTTQSGKLCGNDLILSITSHGNNMTRINQDIETIDDDTIDSLLL